MSEEMKEDEFDEEFRRAAIPESPQNPDKAVPESILESFEQVPCSPPRKKPPEDISGLTGAR